MAKESAEQQSFHTHPSQQKLLALVRAMIGGSRGREDDEHPLPPGPWDPVIRVALERIGFFGPQPEPWRVLDRSARLFFAGILARHPEISDAIGGGHSFGDEVALNPQPLPPRYAFLMSVAQALISRAELLQEKPMRQRAKANSRASSLSVGMSLDLLMTFAELGSG